MITNCVMMYLIYPELVRLFSGYVEQFISQRKILVRQSFNIHNPAEIET